MDSTFNYLNYGTKRIWGGIYEYLVKSPQILMERVDQLSKRRFGRPLGIGLNSGTNALAWVRRSNDFSSRIYLFDYWTKHYKLTSTEVELRLFDQKGKLIHSEIARIQNSELRVIEIDDLLKKADISGDFQGSISFDRLTKGPGFGVPLKFINEFAWRNSLASIHEYGQLENYRFRERQTGVAIYPTSDVLDVGIGLLNCNYTDRDVFPLEIEILNSQGERKRICSQSFYAGNSLYLSLNQMYPDWKKFLGTKAGNILLHTRHSIGRPLVFHFSNSGKSLGLNHTTSDKTWVPRVHAKSAVKNVGKGPVWACGFSIDKDVSAWVSTVNNWGFNLPFTLRCEIFNNRGVNIRKKEIDLAPWETIVVNLKDMLADQGFPFIGHVELSILPQKEFGFIPVSFDANMEFQGTGWRQPINLGTHLFNVSNNEKAQTPNSRTPNNRSKVFARVLPGPLYSTCLYICNPSSNLNYTTESRTSVELVSQSGKKEYKRDIKIPPHGSVLLEIESLFPEFVNSEEGCLPASVYIRDTHVKLIASHLTRNKDTGVYFGDHCFGG